MLNIEILNGHIIFNLGDRCGNFPNPLFKRSRQVGTSHLEEAVVVCIENSVTKCFQIFGLWPMAIQSVI